MTRRLGSVSGPRQGLDADQLPEVIVACSKRRRVAAAPPSLNLGCDQPNGPVLLSNLAEVTCSGSGRTVTARLQDLW